MIGKKYMARLKLTSLSFMDPEKAFATLMWDESMDISKDKKLNWETDKEFYIKTQL